MLKTKLTSKGQVTLPRTVRERLGLRTGDEIEFIEDSAGFRVRRIVDAAAVEKWRGVLREHGGRTSDELVEEMRGR